MGTRFCPTAASTSADLLFAKRNICVESARETSSIKLDQKRMASEKLVHEKYWACMARTTRIVDSWPEWEKGCADNIRAIDGHSASTNRACASSSDTESMQAQSVGRPGKGA